MTEIASHWPIGRRAAAWLVTFIAIVFVVRGPLRWIARGSDDRHTDLTGPYLGARAWVHGQSPYAPDVYWRMAEQAGWHIDEEDREDLFEARTPYPLTTFVLLAPLALLPWSIARLAAMALTTALVLWAIVALRASCLWGERPRATRLFFTGFAVALSPIHSAIGTGNPAAAAVALTVLGVDAASRRRDAFAGIALALAVCLKPPIALAFAGYYLLRGRWRLVGAIGAGVAMCAAIGILRLALSGTPWLADYLYNNGMLLADHGGAIIAGSTSQLQFVNLQYLGFVLFDDTRVAQVFALSLAGLFAVTWLALYRRREDASFERLVVGALAVISLLPIYHRVYDVGLLLLPLLWAVAEAEKTHPWYRRAALLLMVPFLLPGSTIIEILVERNLIPEQMLNRWWWNDLVVPHQVWALTGLAVVLLTAMAVSSKSGSPLREPFAQPSFVPSPRRSQSPEES